MSTSSRLRRLLFRPYLRRRDKIVTAVVFAVVGTSLLALGWIYPWQFALLAALEAAMILVLPTRENPEALEAAADLGMLDAGDLGDGECVEDDQ